MNEVLERMATELEENWNRTDEALRKVCDEKFPTDECGRALYSHKDYADFMNRLTAHERSVCHYGPSWYREENKKMARKFFWNLEERVTFLTGTILGIEKSETRNSVYSYFIRGEKGNAKVTQIYAGGYNIVRLHIRNLVRAA